MSNDVYYLSVDVIEIEFETTTVLRIIFFTTFERKLTQVLNLILLFPSEIFCLYWKMKKDSRYCSVKKSIPENEVCMTKTDFGICQKVENFNKRLKFSSKLLLWPFPPSSEIPTEGIPPSAPDKGLHRPGSGPACGPASRHMRDAFF